MAATNEKQRLYFGSQSSPVAPFRGTFTLSLDGQTTLDIAFDVDATALAEALTNLSTIGSGNLTAEAISGGFEVEFVGDLAALNLNLLTVDASALLKLAANPTLTEVQQGAADVNNATSINSNYQVGDGAGTPTSQTFTFSPAPTQGYWYLAGNLYQYNEVPGMGGIQWEPGVYANVTGSASTGTVTIVTQDNTAVEPELSYDNGDPGFELTQYVAGQKQIYTLTLSSNATAGGFDLNLYSVNNTNIAYNVDGTTLGSLFSSDWDVTGSGPFTFTSKTNTGRGGFDAVTSNTGNPLRLVCGAEIVLVQDGQPDDDIPSENQAGVLDTTSSNIALDAPDLATQALSVYALIVGSTQAETVQFFSYRADPERFTELTGPIPLAANKPITLSNRGRPLFTALPGEAIYVQKSGSGRLGGRLVFRAN